MKKSEIKLTQHYLTERGIDVGGVDGIRGEKTETAIHRFLSDRISVMPEEWVNWSTKRKSIACL
ncbi:MAG: peptidoglycan-binding protein [bacterium]|nr:peptidoglycan-binding protein [bacterium]